MPSGPPTLASVDRFARWSLPPHPASPRSLPAAEPVPPVVPLTRHANGIWYAADTPLPPQTPGPEKASSARLPSRSSPLQGYTARGSLAAATPPKGLLVDLAV